MMQSCQQIPAATTVDARADTRPARERGPGSKRDAQQRQVFRVGWASSRDRRWEDCDANQRTTQKSTTAKTW